MKRLLLVVTLSLLSFGAWAQETTCGNGTIEDGEECDDGNTFGGDGCDKICKVTMCGNGTLDGGERCDNGNANSDTKPNACRGNCKPARCGDKVKDENEACDDGNNRSGDTCRADCQETTIPRAANQPEEPNQTAAELAGLDPNRAFQLSMAISLLGPPGLGLIYGPSAGHFYAGEVGRGVGMTAARAAGAALVFVGQRRLVDGDGGGGLIFVGSLAVTTLALIDILDAPNAVRRSLGQ